MRKIFYLIVKGYLFQGRFSSCPVYTGDYLLAAVRYVEQNPVKAGMVRRPWDYPWSSASFHCGITKKDPLVTDSSLLAGITDWKSFLSKDPDDLPPELQENIRTGRPFGPEKFFSVVEKITGRDTRKKQPGRPKKK